MEHQPPPFFRTGHSPLARLFIFTIVSLALLGADARLKYLDTVRQVGELVAGRIPKEAVNREKATRLARLGINDLT